MSPIELLLRIVALPAAACAVAAALGWMVGLRSPRGREAVLALGVAGAFGGALHALEIRPDLPLTPSQDGWWWILWIAGGAAVLGIAETFLRLPTLVRVVLRAGAGFGAAWLLLSPLVPGAIPVEDRLEACAVAGVVTAALWSVLADPSPRPARTSLPIPVLVALAAAAAIFTEYGKVLRFGAALGALATAVGVTALFALPRREGALLPPAVAAIVAVVFVGFLAAGPGYLNYGTAIRFRPVTGLLLVASAGCAACRSWRSALLLALVAAGAAGVLAGLRDAAIPKNPYGW